MVDVRVPDFRFCEGRTPQEATHDPSQAAPSLTPHQEPQQASAAPQQAQLQIVAQGSPAQKPPAPKQADPESEDDEEIEVMRKVPHMQVLVMSF